MPGFSNSFNHQFKRRITTSLRATVVLTIFLFVRSLSIGQTVCGTANENGTLTLTAPPGNRFTSIEFASYGTPGGSCSTFSLGSCHSATSMSVCSTTFLNQTSASVVASNSVFGDPCVGTVKRLYVRARYEAILPLNLEGFTLNRLGKNHVRLEWLTDHEVNTKVFVIETSTDGVAFDSTGYIKARGSGDNEYTYLAMLGASKVYYYRLKMIDIDGQFMYSPILKFANQGGEGRLSIAHNPSSRKIDIIASEAQEVYITDFNGRVIKKLFLHPGAQSIYLPSIHPGMYILKSREAGYKLMFL